MGDKKEREEDKADKRNNNSNEKKKMKTKRRIKGHVLEKKRTSRGARKKDSFDVTKIQTIAVKSTKKLSLLK